MLLYLVYEILNIIYHAQLLNIDIPNVVRMLLMAVNEHMLMDIVTVKWTFVLLTVVTLLNDAQSTPPPMGTHLLLFT